MNTTLDLVLRQSGGAMQFPSRVGAAILGWSPATIRNMIWQGRLPLPHYTIRGRTYFLAEDVANYLDSLKSGGGGKNEKG